MGRGEGGKCLGGLVGAVIWEGRKQYFSHCRRTSQSGTTSYFFSLFTIRDT